MQSIEIVDQGEGWTTLTVRGDVAGFTEMLADFFSTVDVSNLMGTALSRSAENAAKGVLEELLEQAAAWEEDDEASPGS